MAEPELIIKEEQDDISTTYLPYRDVDEQSAYRGDEYYQNYLKSLEAEKEEGAPPQLPQEPEERQYESEGDWALRKFGEGMSKEDIEAELGGLEQPVYDPIDVAVDVLTGGSTLWGRLAIKTIRQGIKQGEKKLVKEGIGALSKEVGKDVGYGAIAGGFMQLADYGGAHPLIQMISGVLGTTGTATLLTMNRKALAQFMKQLLSKNPKIHKQVMAAVEANPDNELAKALKATTEVELKVKPEEVKVDAKVEKELLEKLGDSNKPLLKIMKEDVTGEAAEEILEGHVKDLPKRAININLSRLETADDVKGMITKVAKQFKPQIDEARRGVQTQEQTTKLADLLGLTPAQLLKRQKGEAFNAEQLYGARKILVASTESLVVLARKAQGPLANDIDKLAFRRQLSVHYAIQSQVSGMTAEAGRALQQFRIAAKATPESLKQIDQLLKAAEGKISTEKLAEMIATQETAEGVNTFVRQAQKAATFDKFYEAWINGLLSGPQTHAVNTMSNSLVAVWQVPERLLAAQFGRVLPGAREITELEAAHQLYGLVEGGKDGLRLAGKVFKTGEPSDIFTKIETRHPKAINLEEAGPAGRVSDYIIHAPTTALMAEDEFFKSLGYRMELRARAVRQAHLEGLKGREAAEKMQSILNDPPDDIKLAAIDAARYQTFTKPLDPGMRGVKTFLNEYPAARLIVPFLRTPTNIIKFAGERTPLGFLSKNIRADIAAGGARRDLALARISMGTTVMAVTAKMTAEGQITGNGPSDPKMRQILRNTGWQPNSIKIGDKYYSYSRLEPIGMLLGIAASFTEIAGQVGDDEVDEIAAAAVIAVSKNITSKTWLRGLTDMIEAFEDPDRFGERWMQRMGGTLIPTGVATVERTLDPTFEEVNSMMDALKSRIPGYSTDLPPRVNIWGEPIAPDQYGFIPIDLISPIYMSEEKYSPVDEELLRLETPLTMPTKQIMGIELNPDEYWRYTVLAGNEAKNPATGQGLKDALTELIKSPEYKRMSDGPDGGKSYIIRRYVQEYRELARAQMLEEFPELKDLILIKAQEKAQQLQPVE